MLSAHFLVTCHLVYLPFSHLSYLPFSHLVYLPLIQYATLFVRYSVYLLFCQLMVLSNFCFDNLPFSLPASYPTCHLVTFCILPTCNFVNLSFCQLAILSTCQFANLSCYQLARLSTCHFAYLPFCLYAILSAFHFVNLPFSLLAILSIAI
jgi:hypothetical protein